MNCTKQILQWTSTYICTTILPLGDINIYQTPNNSFEQNDTHYTIWESLRYERIKDERREEEDGGFGLWWRHDKLVKWMSELLKKKKT